MPALEKFVAGTWRAAQPVTLGGSTTMRAPARCPRGIMQPAPVDVPDVVAAGGGGEPPPQCGRGTHDGRSSRRARSARSVWLAVQEPSVRPLAALLWHQTEEWVWPGGFLPWMNCE